MKKIKKLTLDKEVVSILGGNDMNLVKGGLSFLFFTCDNATKKIIITFVHS